MAWAPDYCTVAELKTHLRIGDSVDDTPLAVNVTASSRAVDFATNRQFGQTSPAAARYYTYEGAELADHMSQYRSRCIIEVDDIMSTTGLVLKVDRDDDGTFEETLTINTDFRMYPWNAEANGRPWTHIVLNAGFTFPYQLRGVEATALWGWSAVPSIVKQATLIQAARFFQRRNAPFGVAGSPDAGSEMRLLDRLDPDVALMVRSVWRPWVAR
jgi:hypothetical protein